MRTSRRYQLRLADALAQDLELFARQQGTGLCAAIRLLIERGLRAEPDGSTPKEAAPDSMAALAALTASEHAILMVASVLPEGQRRRRELAPEAALAAEERLAFFRESQR